MVVLAVAAMLTAPAQAQEETKKPDWKKLLADKAESVVSVKFVIQVKIIVRGQVMQEMEQNQEVRATLINEKGLMVASNSNFSPRSPDRRFTIEAGAPREIKTLFGNEEKEYETVIVAKDTKLDLAFLQILDLGDRKVSHVALTGEKEPSVGQELFAVGRLSRGFDCAPLLGRLDVTGEVEKPRRMWSIYGNIAGGVGMPVYDLDGDAVGLVSFQQGSEGVGGRGEQMRPFVLPLKTLKAQLKMAEERAAEALEEAADAAEEGDKPAEEKPAEEKPVDDKPADDKPADDKPE
jgi:S1-C subfamily serine protease